MCASWKSRRPPMKETEFFGTVPTVSTKYMSGKCRKPLSIAVSPERLDCNLEDEQKQISGQSCINKIQTTETFVFA